MDVGETSPDPQVLKKQFPDSNWKALFVRRLRQKKGPPIVTKKEVLILVNQRRIHLTHLLSGAGITASGRTTTTVITPDREEDAIALLKTVFSFSSENH